MAGKRLTRKEIVQADRIQTTLTTIYEWGTRYAKGIAGLLIVAALSFFGSYFWRNYQNSQEVELQKEFAEALQVFHAPLGDRTGVESGQELTATAFRFPSAEKRHQEALARFEALAQRYPSARLGLLARYYAALNKRELGQPQEARKILNWVIEHTDETDIKNLARSSLAHLALSENDQEEAISLFQDVLDAPWPDFPKPMVLLQLAKSYEAQGNLGEALKQYKKLNADYPSSDYSKEAQQRITQLEAEE